MDDRRSKSDPSEDCNVCEDDPKPQSKANVPSSLEGSTGVVDPVEVTIQEKRSEVWERIWTNLARYCSPVRSRLYTESVAVIWTCICHAVYTDPMFMMLAQNYDHVTDMLKDTTLDLVTMERLWEVIKELSMTPSNKIYDSKPQSTRLVVHLIRLSIQRNSRSSPLRIHPQQVRKNHNRTGNVICVRLSLTNPKVQAIVNACHHHPEFMVLYRKGSNMKPIFSNRLCGATLRQANTRANLNDAQWDPNRAEYFVESVIEVACPDIATGKQITDCFQVVLVHGGGGDMEDFIAELVQLWHQVCSVDDRDKLVLDIALPYLENKEIELDDQNQRIIPNSEAATWESYKTLWARAPRETTMDDEVGIEITYYDRHGRDDTDQVEAAIAKCGHFGTTTFEAGSYNITRKMTWDLVSSKVDLKGFLTFPPDIQFWLNANNTYRVVFIQSQASWFVVTGSDFEIDAHNTGGIQGNGQPWWSFFATRTREDGDGRPISLTVFKATRATIKNFRIESPPFWSSAIVQSTDVVVDGMFINATNQDPAFFGQNIVPNTDGTDTYRSDRVSLLNWDVTCGDDCLALKGNSTNIVARNITCRGGTGVAIGSLGQYIGLMIRLDPKIQPIMVNGVYFKSWDGSVNGAPPTGGGGAGGLVNNLTVRNMHIDGVDMPVHILQNNLGLRQANSQPILVLKSKAGDLTLTIAGTLPPS
ncbi:hypothetical protein CVT25_015430 [Psilocybe cyanescens]|uniref:galacturonan 1,4-alpha-galacturonidase n=1 Tax=Psilocybe cyanescens TaxID=93625 RepID=A0A409WHI8_PSICY|nr:hypothetical protein CVT25_015430 [Psilocybe cyanescens]